MKINMSLDTDNFIEYDEYGKGNSFEEHIVDKVISELSYNISNSKHWQESHIINRLLDDVLKESNGSIKIKFEEAIESKINKSNVTSKLNKKISEITKEEMIKNVINLIDMESIIRGEVIKIMDEKFR